MPSVATSPRKVSVVREQSIDWTNCSSLWFLLMCLFGSVPNLSHHHKGPFLWPDGQIWAPAQHSQGPRHREQPASLVSSARKGNSSLPNHFLPGRELLFPHGCLQLVCLEVTPTELNLPGMEITGEDLPSTRRRKKEKLTNSCPAHSILFLRTLLQSSLFGFMPLVPCPQMGLLCYSKPGHAFPNYPSAIQLTSHPVIKSVSQSFNQSVSSEN